MISIQFDVFAAILLAFGAQETNANPGDCDIKKCPPEFPHLTKLCECYYISAYCSTPCPEGQSPVDTENGPHCKCIDNDLL